MNLDEIKNSINSAQRTLSELSIESVESMRLSEIIDLQTKMINKQNEMINQHSQFIKYQQTMINDSNKDSRRNLIISIISISLAIIAIVIQ